MIKTLRRLSRHVKEWIAVIREERGELHVWPMVRALLTGYAGRRVWTRRMRTCQRCPIYDRQFRRCRGPRFNGLTTGCGCYVVFQAATRAPYQRGCWGFEASDGTIGWPSV